MISHKHISKVIIILTVILTFSCLVSIVYFNNVEIKDDAGVTMEYESKLFDNSKNISINIIMDEDKWDDLLKNAIDEKYYKCDVEVDGKLFKNVAIRAKGNTSLASVVEDPNSDRYAFKLEFDHYIESQRCYGLDKLSLNNNFSDATSMKEALIYDMYKYIGADASLYNYAEIKVNNKYWGVYLALEAVEESFTLRNYGYERGILYKPEGNNVGDNKENIMMQNPPMNTESVNKDAAPQNQNDMMNQERQFKGDDLNYTDDNLDSYTTIWEGAKTKTTTKDYKRVLQALKNIHDGTDLEKYMDIDNLLRYMAVHVFSVNDDSLTGNMPHNYYLYEKNSRLNLLPWDYNLSLGGMGQKSASSVINSAIDNAFIGTQFFDKLMENETYKNKYHEYMKQLVDEYINGEGFDNFYKRTRKNIDNLVKTDQTAFYTYEEYEKAANTLYKTVKLRGEAITKQLDGTIPSIESERTSEDKLVDTAELDLTVMGTMEHGNKGQQEPSMDNKVPPFDNNSTTHKEPPGDRNNPPFGNNERPQQMPPETGEGEQIPPGFGGEGEQIPPGFGGEEGNMRNNVLLNGVSFIILVLALVYVISYKRKSYRL